MKKNMHFLTALTLVIFCVIVLSTQVWAVPEIPTYTAGDFRFQIGTRGEVIVVGYTGSETTVVIPSSFEGTPVSTIGNSAFYGCTSLQNITIPDSVTSIGDSAFYGCTGLTGVTIGNGVTKIGNFVFYGCSSLTSFTIPEGVTSIGGSAF